MPQIVQYLLAIMMLTSCAFAQQSKAPIPMPLDTVNGTISYYYESDGFQHNRMDFFFKAAKFIGKHKQLKDILTFEVIYPDSTLIYANGHLSPILNEVRVHITYKIRLQVMPDYYNYIVYDFKIDGNKFEDIYYYEGQRFSPKFLSVMNNVYHLTHNHVLGVMNSLVEVLGEIKD